MNANGAKLALGIASVIQAEVVRMNLRPPIQEAKESHIYDTLITDQGLRETTRDLFFDGYYALAVEEAFKYLNNEVKNKTRISADGANLMKQAFSANNPILYLNDMKTQSKKDQQLGYMEIFAGCMTGIRNPRAHEHQYLDEPHNALEMLSLANHLLRLLSTAKRVRRRRTK